MLLLIVYLFKESVLLYPPLVQPTGGISLSTRILESYVFHLVVAE